MRHSRPKYAHFKKMPTLKTYWRERERDSEQKDKVMHTYIKGYTHVCMFIDRDIDRDKI